MSGSPEIESHPTFDAPGLRENEAPQDAITSILASDNEATLAKAVGVVSTIRGFVDGLLDREIAGWAYASEAPTDRVQVRISSEGKLLAAGIADFLRPDLKESGHSDGRCGFRISLPEEIFDGQIHTIEVGFDHPSAAPLNISLNLELRQLFGKRQAHDSEIAAVSLLGNPGVSESDSPLPAIYVPGQFVTCSRPWPLPPYHTHGWHEPEDGFVWIDGMEGTIELHVRRPRVAYTLTLEVSPNAASGQLQTLEIFLNYFRVGFFEISRRSVVTMKIPTELFILRSTRISLHCRNAVPGTSYGNPDNRRLGIAVHGWSLS